MTTGYYVKLYFATLFAFFMLDMAWFGWIARPLYQNYLGALLTSNINWPVVILFYLLFSVGLLVFVIIPGGQSGSLQNTLVLAAFFGLVTYATYDLVNLATIKDWPVLVTLIDLVWGVLLSTAVSYVGFTVGKWLEQNDS
jgi:uncharacterized membrane protein